MSKKKPAIAPKTPATIGFRLDESSARVLTDRAAKLRVSAHELARHYVVEALCEVEDRRGLHEKLEALYRELVACRQDLAAATEATLHASGNVSGEKAFAWVKENLNRPCLPSPIH